MDNRVRSAVLQALAVAAVMLFMCGTWMLAHECHRRFGSCGGPSGCGWAWCRYYDGRDFLYDL